MIPVTHFPREAGTSEANNAIIDIAEALGASSYTVHSHEGCAAFSIMLSFDHTAGIFQARDVLRGKPQ